MKKFLSVLLAAVLAFSLAACGGGGSSSAGGSSSGSGCPSRSAGAGAYSTTIRCPAPAGSCTRTAS